jgi:hypothetical protein
VDFSTKVDLYFLTRLSIQGEMPKISPRMEGEMTVHDLALQYCVREEAMSGGLIWISHIQIWPPERWCISMDPWACSRLLVPR